MTSKQPKPVENMTMSGKDFDRIMSKVLQVKPCDPKAQQKVIKVKPARKHQTSKK
jgi:hypothetical protein